ncbi:response regulator [Sporosarcina contaminans]|uniref:Response regulator n=1 Tax=Sporosarcina contaminans TaxID=633403 RepID=A0ABW3TZJ0_9BACL
MRIGIVENHPVMRKGLVSLFAADQRYEVVGEADHNADAMKLLSKVKPDLFIVDLQLGQEYGLDFIVEAKKRGYAGKFLIFTSSISKKDFWRAQEIGVEGLILKEALPEEILHALQIIQKGRKYYDSSIVEFKINSHRLHSNQYDSIEQLTPKEMEVLLKLGKGYSNKEISQALFITEYTVKKHVSQILSKLELSDRTHAALFANAIGLVTYMAN